MKYFVSCRGMKEAIEVEADSRMEAVMPALSPTAWTEEEWRETGVYDWKLKEPAPLELKKPAL